MSIVPQAFGEAKASFQIPTCLHFGQVARLRVFWLCSSSVGDMLFWELSSVGIDGCADQQYGIR